VLVPPEQLPALPHLGGARGSDRVGTVIRFAERVLTKLQQLRVGRLTPAARGELERCVREALADELSLERLSFEAVRQLLSYRGTGEGLQAPIAKRAARRVRSASSK
jgi:hypothetical protein